MQETGLSMSAALAGYLVSLLRPRFVFMLGMCCGLNDKKSPSKSVLGDVIVANETACWDEGKYSDELNAQDPFYVRSVTRTPENSFRLRVSGLIEINSGDIMKELNSVSELFNLEKIKAECGEQIAAEPKLHLGLILSGSSVVDSVKQVDMIRQRFPSAIGLEMEAHSIYCAVDAAIGIRPFALVIKGVADHGQGKKNKSAQPWASAMSYATAKKFLEWLG